MKLNADATIYDGGWVGLGVVVQDHLGCVLLVATKGVRVWWLPKVAEGKALFLVLKLARGLNVHHAIVEFDCESLVKKLSKLKLLFSSPTLIYF